jgi:uncharacterized protein YgiM (DUF1202 family)
MKKIYIIAMLLGLQSQATYADLAQDLRQLRNTISETSKTGKELSDLAGANKSTEPSRPQVKPSATDVSIKEGDVLVSKVDNIKLYQLADKKSNVMAKLSKRDEVIFTGYDSNGLYSVNANGNEGWVEKILVKQR